MDFAWFNLKQTITAIFAATKTTINATDLSRDTSLPKM